MSASKLKVLFVYSDRYCTCTVKRCFEVVNGLWRHQNDTIDVAAIHIDNLNENHFQDFKVILFQRLGANGKVISELTQKNLHDWMTRYNTSCRFVYDIDDFLFSSQNHYPQTMAKLCHYGLVPNAYLENQMVKYQSHCRVIKTHVDTDTVERSAKKDLFPEDKIHIGWFSCSANGVETIKNALDLMDKQLVQRLQIHLFCDVVFHDLAKNSFSLTVLRLYPMVAPSEMYQYLLSMKMLLNPLSVHSLHEEHIGIKQEDFNHLIQGKSEVKYALAGACSIPLIVTPIRSYEKVIQHKVNGLLADNPQEWADAITFLAENPSEAQGIGKNAYDDVIQNYSLQRAAKDYADLFIEICP